MDPDASPDTGRSLRSGDLSAADRLELRAISDRYATAVDERDVEGLLACFLPDGLLRMRSSSTRTHEHRGHSELAEIFELLRPHVLTMHDVTTWSVAHHGPEPSAVVYCSAHHILLKDGMARDRIMHIRYEDDYAHDGDREWRLRQRVATVMFTEQQPVRLP